MRKHLLAIAAAGMLGFVTTTAAFANDSPDGGTNYDASTPDTGSHVIVDDDNERSGSLEELLSEY